MSTFNNDGASPSSDPADASDASDSPPTPAEVAAEAVELVERVYDEAIEQIAEQAASDAVVAEELVDELIEDAEEEIAEAIALAEGAEEVAREVVAEVVAEAIEDIEDAAEALAEAVTAGELSEAAAEAVLEAVIEAEVEEVEEVLAEADAFVEAAEELAVAAGEEALEELEVAEAIEAAVHDEVTGAEIEMEALADEKVEVEMAIVEEAVEEELEEAIVDEIVAEIVEAAIEEEIEEAVEEALEADSGDEAVLSEDELLAQSVTPSVSPYDRPGSWFVVHTQSGYEKKVKQNLEARTQSMNMEERIHEVVIPMEDVVEFKNGKKVVVQKKMFPGYLLVRCELDDDSWYVIRNTPGVTGFVGQGAKPSPLPKRDVETFLQVKPEGDDAPKRIGPRHDFENGETVQIREGPFSEFNGEIIEINEEQLRVKVLVNIFGRETPVELEFSQIAKL